MNLYYDVHIAFKIGSSTLSSMDASADECVVPLYSKLFKIKYSAIKNINMKYNLRKYKYSKKLNNVWN